MHYDITYTEQNTYSARVKANSKDEALAKFNSELINDSCLLSTEERKTKITEVTNNNTQ